MAAHHLMTLKLTSYIEAMIAGGNFAPGDKLPPLRDLAELFGLTLSTARRSVMELCDRGILELRHGSGTYVKAREIQNFEGHSVAVVFFEKTLLNSYCAYALQGLQEKARERNWRLHLYFYSYDRVEQLQQETFGDSEIIVLMGCYDTYDLSRLSRRLPGVGLEMHSSLDGQFSTITLDPFDAAEIVRDYFLQKKVRQVKIVDAEMLVHMTRAKILGLVLGEWGKIIPDTRDFDIEEDCGYVFVSGSSHEEYAKIYRRKTGRMLAENPLVLSLDGKSLLLPGFLPSNTIGIDWLKAGETVANECLRRMENPGSAAHRIYIAPKLYLYSQNQGEHFKMLSFGELKKAPAPPV